MNQDIGNGRPPIRADLSRYFRARKKTDAKHGASWPKNKAPTKIMKTTGSKTGSALSSQGNKASNKASGLDKECNKARAKLSRHRKIMEAQISQSGLPYETAVNVFDCADGFSCRGLGIC
eukprot:CAMPEP_0172552188 /NCGR_PEP_ID=MMETSP1067-20121228/43677_1 /TAXON_ID=265564 ORGANISM="Thalassiosira punctigera, Strain Tpunct2005C2" /NCGR_SAMPLE_ID=MMETSP1067 /ASSEMBLY_ACC=CAM_ASM_000444 /LENGTH=119 /DNA_ID=CAMNT_0013340111 /DNA_START=314 /DNA_END=670 /DNA_ORIENTATION=-